ncbi:MAG: protein RecA [Patescibacteria group bacterium]|nr:MAG: protein RecA [Patescibacteria group bacterium]
MAKQSNDKEQKVENLKGGVVVSERQQALMTAMAQIEKSFGKGSIMKLGEQAHMQVEVIPTGSIALDLALGIGGLPRGRIVEIYGPESSGKTTVCLHVIAQAQKVGGIAAFIDAEHALDPVRAAAIGVDLDNLLISQPDSGEQALEIAETLIRSGTLDVLVIDSVAALVPRSELEGDMGDAVMGVQARLMSQALRKLTAIINKSKTIVIFTNQLRQKIGVMFGNPETTTGGMALKFYASVRMDIRKIENIKGAGDKILGSRHRVKIVKNKLAPPFRIAEFDMDEHGISYEGGLLDVGLELGVLSKAGSFIRHTVSGEMLGQGREASKDNLRNSQELSKKVHEEIIAAWRAQEGKTAPDQVVGAEEDEEVAGFGEDE